MFEWLMVVEALRGHGVRDLMDGGFSVESLRRELNDIASALGPGPKADRLLSRFEASLLQRDVDPFR